MDNKIKSLSKIAENRRMSSDSGMALVLILLICYAFLGIKALLIAAIAVLVLDMTVPVVFCRSQSFGSAFRAFRAA